MQQRNTYWNGVIVRQLRTATADCMLSQQRTNGNRQVARMVNCELDIVSHRPRTPDLVARRRENCIGNGQYQMTDLVRDIYFACGIKYFAFLILSFIVVFAYMMKSLLSSNDRSALWSLSVLSLSPLAIGLYATYEGDIVVLHMERSAKVSSDEAEYGYAIARVTSYFGASLSAPLILLAIAGVAMRLRRRQIHVLNAHESPGTSLNEPMDRSIGPGPR